MANVSYPEFSELVDEFSNAYINGLLKPFIDQMSTINTPGELITLIHRILPGNMAMN